MLIRLLANFYICKACKTSENTNIGAAQQSSMWIYMCNNNKLAW